MNEEMMGEKWEAKCRELIVPDVEQLQCILKEKGEAKFVKAYRSWVGPKGKKFRYWEHFCEDAHSKAAFGVDLEFCRIIAWLEVYFWPYESEDTLQSLCTSVIKDNDGVGSIWWLIGGRDKEFFERAKPLLSGGEATINYVTDGCAKKSYKYSGFRLLQAVSDARDFDRPDIVLHLMDSIWPFAVGEKNLKRLQETVTVEGKQYTFNEAADKYLSAHYYWAKARENQDKVLAQKAKDEYYESFYRAMFLRRADRKFYMTKYFPILIDYQFGLNPAFDYEKYCSLFKGDIYDVKTFRDLIDEKGLTVPPLDTSVFPPDVHTLTFLD